MASARVDGASKLGPVDGSEFSFCDLKHEFKCLNTSHYPFSKERVAILYLILDRCIVQYCSTTNRAAVSFFDWNKVESKQHNPQPCRVFGIHRTIRLLEWNMKFPFSKKRDKKVTFSESLKVTRVRIILPQVHEAPSTKSHTIPKQSSLLRPQEDTKDVKVRR